MEYERALLVLEGPAEEQVRAAVHELARRGALDPGPACRAGATRPGPDPGARSGLPGHRRARRARPSRGGGRAARGHGRTWARGGCRRPRALSPGEGTAASLGAAGADLVVVLDGSSVAEDVADAVADYVRAVAPWALLAPSTAFGREVAGRTAAATGSGLVGDAIALSAHGGALVAAKPALAGALVADITSTSATQMATVRPGVLPAPALEHHEARVATRRVGTPGPGPGAVRAPRRRHRDAGPGSGGDRRGDRGDAGGIRAVEPARRHSGGPSSPPTRKVTDRGWAPLTQVGITGRSIAPRLYVALGLSGKFNHMVGVRAAGTILAVNTDPGAPVFAHCDVGIVGDWHEVVPLLRDACCGTATPSGTRPPSAEGPPGATRHYPARTDGTMLRSGGGWRLAVSTFPNAVAEAGRARSSSPGRSCSRGPEVRRAAHAVSMPSTTVVDPIAAERLMTAETIADLTGSQSTPSTKLRSILTTSMGKRVR